ncbi:MAG TPA: ATP-binding protein [Myxococcota bacterium]|nr:ATP-binding protein [Myxococcota bacterium]
MRTIDLRDPGPISPEEARRLLHELRVHEIELEMQNEELRAAQVELEASRARYFELYDLAPVGYLSLDRTGRVIESNLRAASLLGVGRGDLKDRPLLGFVVRDCQSRFLAHYRELFALGAPQLVELELQSAQGAPFWARLEAVMHREEQPGGVCRLTLTDISASKRVEHSLRASEERVERLLRVLPIAVYASDARGNFTFFNESAAQLWGRTPAPGETVDQFERSFSFRAPDGSPCDYEATPMAAAARDRQPIHGADVTIERPDGTRVEWLIHIDPLKQEGQPRDGLIYAFVDQTERKRVARELDRSVRKLERADRQKDEFIAMLSHELRNPLAPIRSSLEVIRLLRLDDPVLARCREVIERQVGQLVRLLDDLLDISRIARGSLEVKRSAVALGEVVDVAVETSRPLLDSGEHALEIQLPAEPIKLRADPTRIGQVLSNLLNNAARYSDPKAPIALRARCEGEGAERRVTIEVADQGIGLTPEEQAGVFELFQQGGARSRSRNPQGLGIGLALARHIVELHGGSISVASAGIGRGAVFTVCLPIEG